MIFIILNLKVQFENECQYVEATMSEFIVWNESDSEGLTKKRKLNTNPFDSFDKLEYWAYADYKYMIELLKSDTNEIKENVSLSKINYFCQMSNDK